jgi:hypothetical protein
VKWVAGGLLAALVALGIAISMVLRRAEPFLRAQIVEALEDHFHSHVELDSFHVSLVNGLWAEGKGLRIWPPTQQSDTGLGASGTAAPGPLIRLDDFRFHAPLHYTPGKPIRISVIELKGLDIDVPTRSHLSHPAAAGGSGETKPGSDLFAFEIDSIDCKGAHLKLETSKPGKLPLEFEIARVRLTHVRPDGPVPFVAALTNPRPPGTIQTSGEIGPWNVGDPGETPVEGEYQFANADLGVFKGIAGILNSEGTYQGILRNLTVDGQTDTPDFRLTQFGAQEPLHTKFHATVDGTDGDTWLHPVDAILGQSHFTAEGTVVRVLPGMAKNGAQLPGGHDIALTVHIARGRMDDFLRLTSKNGAPLLNGVLTVESSVEIPPGTAAAHDRLRLKGSFALDDAEFANEKIQHRIGELSWHGQGRPQDQKDDMDGVQSAMQSRFTMADGVIELPDLIYTVPGAEIDLKGAYGLDGGTLDFAGTAKTDAKVSQMVGGWKGKLLRPADRFFEKDGAGTEVPIHVGGTRENPDFGIDFGHNKHTSPQVPGESQ